MSLSCNDIVNSYDVNTPPQTNLQCWLQYMQFAESPNSFIVLGFYAAIGAALQRRVFKQHNTVRLYPNPFCVLVGDASTGKGRVIKPLKGLLKSFQNDNTIFALDADGKEQAIAGNHSKPSEDATAEDKSTQMSETTIEQIAEKSSLSDNLLYPIPADSSSLRAVTAYMAQSQRCIYYLDEKKVKRVYLHSSACFMLEEIVSLFKSKQETKDMVDFLVQTWDSGDYRHATFGYGIDDIMNSCVSLIAGTTPDSMEDLFTSKLLKEGISSRTLFVVENDKRFRHFCTESCLKPEQITSYKRLKNWFHKLAYLYGPVEFSTEAISYLKIWYEENFEASIVNKNTRLGPYYGRKDMHIMKLAMAIHFAERLDRRVTLDDVKMAHAILDSIEPNMHLALHVGNRNELASVTRKLVGFIRKYGPINANALWLEFSDDFKNLEELKTLLLNLKELGRVATDKNGKYVSPDSPLNNNGGNNRLASTIADISGMASAHMEAVRRQQIT